MDLDESTIATTIAQRYKEYKNSVAKIGLEEAQNQYVTITYHDLGNERWKLDLLRECFFIQSVMVRFSTNADLAGRHIRPGVRLLTNESFLHDNAQEVVATLDWFDELEDQDPLRQGTWNNLVEGFIHLQTRCEIVRCIVQYDPLVIPEITEQLLQSAGRLSSSRYQIYLCEMVYTIVQEHPTHAADIRYKLIGRQLLPELITRITVVHGKDEIDVLNGIFHGFPSWFMAQTASSIAHFNKIKTRIFAEIERSKNDNSKVELAMAIRALAGLVGYLGIKLTEGEIAKCLDLCRMSQTERIVKLSLSLMLVVSDQAIRSQRNLGQVLSQLLQSGVSEMPMLLMVYFQTDQFAQIETMARSILDMHVAIPKLGLFEMQKLFASIQNT
ncbi:hypothetical protein K492DRAFT_205507 [Lichtheimia hyalospora FSU 10163]|nr:hypothetical protein K492DRAFT_205507 [Lichtheimia hyalospora FSU 10163]